MYTVNVKIVYNLWSNCFCDFVLTFASFLYDGKILDRIVVLNPMPNDVHDDIYIVLYWPHHSYLR